MPHPFLPHVCAHILPFMRILSFPLVSNPLVSSNFASKF